MVSTLLWPAACLVAGLILLMAEVFVPSGGVIGFLSIGLLIVSIYQAFAISSTTGLVFLAILSGLLPLTIALAIKIWPHTPMGKWLFLSPPEVDEAGNRDGGPRLEHLLGEFGRALTPLRPSGLVDFEGRRLDGMAEEGLIPSGTLVRAIRIRGGQIVVRVAEASELDLDAES